MIVNYIPEPSLIFNKGGTAKTPCIGLLKHGPRRFPYYDDDFYRIKLGIIGTSKSISIVRRMLEDMKSPLIPKEVKPWRVYFPGLYKDSPLKFSIETDRAWTQEITYDDLNEFNEIEPINEKIRYILRTIENKIRIISNKETPPEVILICIPKEVEDGVAKGNLKKPLIKTDTGDFHNLIKVYSIKYGIPTQIVRWSTLIQEGTQDKATIFWNLSIGLLYKAQKGHPWKLAKLEENTCYVGISFFKEIENRETYLRTSMAQVFLETGESFILRGDKFEPLKLKNSKSPHMAQEDAEKLIEKVISHYKEIKGQEPFRIVLHKSSNYFDEEYKGFINGCKNIKYKDFLTIQDNTAIRLFRPSTFPVMRGTLANINYSDDYYLFTTGFVQSLTTYPGYSIPRPLLVRCKTNDTQIEILCEEILALTKLDWNNTFVYQKMPATLSVSRKVGHILAESEAKKIQVDPHYYYYM